MSEEGRDYEAEAREQGWVPPEEYTGSGEGVDAKTFVERGEKYVGFVKSRLDKVEAQLNEQKAINQDFIKQRERERKVEQQRLDTMRQKLEEARVKAIESADGAGFQKAEKDLRELDQREQELQNETSSAPQSADEPPQWFKEWNEDNPWYGTDADATAIAERYSAQLRAMNPDLTEKKFLEKVGEYVKTALPHKFKKTEAPGAADVEEGGNRGGPPQQSGGKGYAAMPADAKKECNRLLKNGYFKDKEQYAEIYWAEQAQA